MTIVHDLKISILSIKKIITGKKITKRWTATGLSITSVAASVVNGHVNLAGAATTYANVAQFYVGQTLTITCRNRQYEKKANSAMVSSEMKIVVKEGADASSNAKWTNVDGGADVNVNDIDCKYVYSIFRWN